MLNSEQLFAAFDASTGMIGGRPMATRHLSDLRGLFVDAAAFEAALAAADPLVYTVASVDFAQGEGQLHCGLGVIHPGKVGNEYYFTRGHLHSWRAAAEFYIGVRGHGVMILEEFPSGESSVIDLLPDSIVYVPAHTAHRTVNTGDTPLVYLGIYPSDAGHDYQAIAERNFRKVVVAQRGVPTVMNRADLNPNQLP
jgi:glucose-6-phosphate isomerase